MRIIATIITLLAAMQMASAQEKVVIEGTLDVPDGWVDIWKHEYECRRDTSDFIATAEVRDGRFRIECDAPDALVCRVYRKDYPGWCPVFLEAGEFKSSVGEKNRDLHFTGGSNQQIFNEFHTYHLAAWRKYRELLARYDNNLDRHFDKIRPQANLILKDLIASLDGFFRKYHDEPVAAYVLYMLSVGAEIGSPEAADLRTAYNLLAESPRNTPYGRRAAETIRKIERGQLQ